MKAIRTAGYFCLCLAIFGTPFALLLRYGADGQRTAYLVGMLLFLVVLAGLRWLKHEWDTAPEMPADMARLDDELRARGQ